MYSAVILTLNEEAALPDCLASLRCCGDVVVLDSGSTDSTVRIAEAAGARVFTRKFDTFAAQRNFALTQIPFKNSWVLHLDADERMTPALDAECQTATLRTDLNGYRIAPKMIFEGRWIRHCSDYPAFQARLVRAKEFEFVQVGHGQRESPTMKVENLVESYLHDISIYGEDAWIEKHKRYAKAEAARVVEGADSAPNWTGLFSSNALIRRRTLKSLSFNLPLRGPARFIYQYVLRRGFLDGRQGLRYCVLLARYEGFISLEIAHMRERNKVTHTSES